MTESETWEGSLAKTSYPDLIFARTPILSLHGFTFKEILVCVILGQEQMNSQCFIVESVPSKVLDTYLWVVVAVFLALECPDTQLLFQLSQLK